MSRQCPEGLTPDEVRQRRIIARNLKDREKLNQPKEVREWEHKPLVAFPVGVLDKIKVAE
jgi:hypothetical protein